VVDASVESGRIGYILIRAEMSLATETRTGSDPHVELELDGAPDRELAVRVDGVLRTLYVLFLEGYSAHAGDAQIDNDGI